MNDIFLGIMIISRIFPEFGLRTATKSMQNHGMVLLYSVLETNDDKISEFMWVLQTVLVRN